MLTRLGQTDASGAMVRIADAAFPAPFRSELEYSCSARGAWNIVHTGFLVPDAHEIYVCAAGCLRGVVLTAAEMQAEARFSTIEIREHNVLEGDMEALLVEGVSDILAKLPYRPRAVLLFTSCIHHFIGCDLPLCYDRLRERFPDIDFTDCYMNPIMRKSGLNPDQLMRRQLYSLLHERPHDPKKISIIGNNLATDKHCELYTMAHKAGFAVGEIHDCPDYDSYQEMAAAAANICFNPAAKAGGEALEKRLGQRLLYLPLSYDYEEIGRALAAYAQYLGIPVPDCTGRIAACEEAFAHARAVIGDAPVVIDYTATMRPLSLALTLIRHGFRVTAVYADGFTGEEQADFETLRTVCPELKLYATVQVKMRVLPRQTQEKTLAVGQKAAYFTGTPYFVNTVEGGGFWGFTGIAAMLRLMEEAFREPKDTRRLVQIKGLGCGIV